MQQTPDPAGMRQLEGRRLLCTSSALSCSSLQRENIDMLHKQLSDYKTRLRARLSMRANLQAGCCAGAAAPH